MPDESDLADPDGNGPDLSTDVIEEATRLTRLARTASDPGEADARRSRRDALLDGEGYRARVREDGGTDAVLVLYPTDWFEAGVVRTDRIETIDRAVERPLSEDSEVDWERVEAYNRAIANRVAHQHGPVHGATADAFADFMSNHYARPIDSAGNAERERFRTDYFPRNAWPSDDQRAVLDESLTRLFEVVRDGETNIESE